MSENESLWLVEASKGDVDAFARIVEQYQKPVFNLCYRMLGNVEDAEDAAQEAFLRAFKSIRRYDPRRPFGTWLLSIASHYCIDQLRKKKAKGFSLDDEENSWRAPEASSPKPETVAIQREHQAEVQDLLTILNPLDRATIVLRYWYDYSYEEIAKTLNLSISAVKSRLHRARKALAEQWKAKESQEKILNVERARHESPAF